MSLTIAYDGNDIRKVLCPSSQEDTQETVLLTKGKFCTDNIVLTSTLDVLESEIPDHGDVVVTGSLSGVSRSGRTINYIPANVESVGSVLFQVTLNGGDPAVHTATYIDLDNSNDTEHTALLYTSNNKSRVCIPLVSYALMTHRLRVTITDGSETLYIQDNVPRYMRVMINRMKTDGRAVLAEAFSILSCLWRFWSV